MKIRRMLLLAGVPIALAGTIAVSTAGPASAAPSGHASCVAQITTDPTFGPPGTAPGGPFGGPGVRTVAHGDRSDCVGVLLGILGTGG